MTSKTTPPIDYWPDDWIRDTRELTCAAKGFWHDACMFMLVDRTDRLTHTPAEFGRKMGCGTAAANRILDELERHKTCDIVRTDSLTVSILSRRYKADVEKRKLNAAYQLEHRDRLRKDKVREIQGRPSVQLLKAPTSPTTPTTPETERQEPKKVPPTPASEDAGQERHEIADPPILVDLHAQTLWPLAIERDRRKDWAFFGRYSAHVARWKDAYPDVDVEGEIKRLLSWYEETRPAYSDLTKFLGRNIAKKHRRYPAGPDAGAGRPVKTWRQREIDQL